MTERTVAGPGKGRTSFWNDANNRAILFQLAIVAAVLLVGWYLVSNLLANLATRHIATGFDFLHREAGFDIGEHVIPYSPADTYGYAYLVGILNTLKVAAFGIVFATILGTILGIARLSTNWLIARIASAYVELVRNVPLLLQLFLWYTLVNSLPGARQALNPLPDVFLSNRGLTFPVLVGHPVHGIMLVLFFAGILATLYYRRFGRRRQAETGKPMPLLWPALGLIFGLPLVAFILAGAPLQLDAPALRGFNFGGGATITPEFTTLLFGLVIYTAAYIAEVVRAGILAVAKGQTEAALALGLPPGRVLRLVVLPQALRIIIPPMTSLYLDLTKNSSLAVGVGYPDLVSIGNTTINQTGQAIEGFTMMMAVYLSISLAIAAFMNWYNRRIALVER
ncbi:MAG TPA: amino acid ABC transporter permease [Candidatus Sulfotelmatobacter sp.]|nr:amino acid ABC transporter permease [Candidatus Sulfotelmatobacter sp.]